MIISKWNDRRNFVVFLEVVRIFMLFFVVDGYVLVNKWVKFSFGKLLIIFLVMFCRVLKNEIKNDWIFGEFSFIDRDNCGSWEKIMVNFECKSKVVIKYRVKWSVSMKWNGR